MDQEKQQRLAVATYLFTKALSESGLKGPKVTQIEEFLKELQERVGPPPKSAFKSHRRHAKTLPTGGFQKRVRTLKIGGNSLDVDSITASERALHALTLRGKLKNMSMVDMATAIASAYPENNYTEQRIVSAFKRLAADAATKE